MTENTANLKFPKVWPGYLMGAVTAVSVVSLLLLRPNPKPETPFTPVTVMLSFFLIAAYIGGLIYWFLSVHRLHKTLQEATNGLYPVTPGKGTWYQLIPFFNFYWMFKWTGEIAGFVNFLHGNEAMGKRKYGVWLLVATMLSRTIAGLSLIINFAVMGALIRRVKAALADRALPVEDYRKEKYAGRAPMICLWIFVGLIVVGVLAMIAFPNLKARHAARAKAQISGQTANTAVPATP